MNFKARAEGAPLRSGLPGPLILPYELDLYQDNIPVDDREWIKSIHVYLALKPILGVEQHVEHLVYHEF